MSALLDVGCVRMQHSDLDQVLAIEQRVYPSPWSRGNFEDSLNSAYLAYVLRDAEARLLGYFLLMPVLDEAHLLNISVDADLQHRGWGQRLMTEAIDLARAQQLGLMLLEVRVSNLQALAFYRRYGFTEIGRRKNYYPATANHLREDAIMMTLSL